MLLLQSGRFINRMKIETRLAWRSCQSFRTWSYLRCGHTPC